MKEFNCDQEEISTSRLLSKLSGLRENDPKIETSFDLMLRSFFTCSVQRRSRLNLSALTSLTPHGNNDYLLLTTPIFRDSRLTSAVPNFSDFCSMGKSQGTPLLAAGGMDRRVQHMATSNRGWLFPWNLPWTNRGDKLAK